MNYFAILEGSSNDKTIFKALKEGKVIAEASSLDELASILKSKGIDPRA